MYCSKSYSGRHSFEDDVWVVVGEPTHCVFCGLYLDSVTLDEFKKIKNKHLIGKNRFYLVCYLKKMYKPPRNRKPDRVRCYFCNKELKMDDLGGMFSIGEELRCFCTNIICLVQFDDWTKGEKKNG